MSAFNLKDAKIMTGRAGRTPAPRDAGLAMHYAHRGFHSGADIPENSMAAFRRAVEHGFPTEFDVHLIAGGTLAVFHDDELERMTGVKGQIEDYDIVNLSRLRLAGTDERIPTLDEVLELFEDTGLELLIELKVARGNYKDLAMAVCSRLDSYTGKFVIESFDPRALAEVRRIRPEIIRGQLSQNFFRNREGLPLHQATLLTNLMLNDLVRPDFIAYRYEDRDYPALRHVIDKQGKKEASWTITTPEDYWDAVAAGCVPIFEGFDPTEPEDMTEVLTEPDDVQEASETSEDENVLNAE